MKKIFILVFALVLILGCSSENDSSSPSGSSDSSSGDTGKGGSLARFTIAKEHLYTVDRRDLKVFSLKTSEDPVFINTVPVGFDIETLFGYNNYLFIGSRNGMFIYDITSPESPSYVSEAQHFTACDPVIANDKYAFVTLNTNNAGCGNTNLNVLKIYNIENIKSPVEIKTYNLAQPIGIGLFGNNLIVCDDEVKIFDVTKAEDAKFVHNLKNVEAFDVIVYGDLLVLIGKTGLHQYRLDPNDIKNTVHLSTIKI